MTEQANGYTPQQRYQLRAGHTYLTGIQALVRAVLDQGRRDRAAGRDVRGLVTGYEGSPLAGYDLELIRRRTLLDELGIVHRPAVNEELAATSIVGTQLARTAATLTCDGVTGWWYGKSPGLDRATDALRHANLIGTDPRGGVVLVVGDDPAAKSSTVPGCSEAALADLNIPTLLPADPQEVLEFSAHAVQLSRMSGLWAALRVTTMVADSSATVELAPWSPPDLTGMPPGLTPYSHTPTAHVLGATLLGLEQSLATVRLPLAQEYLRRAGVDRIVGATVDTPRGATANADTGVRVGLVAAGPTYLALRQALWALGATDDESLAARGIRILRVGAPWPLDHLIVRRFARGLREVFVVEDKRTFLEDQVRVALYGGPDRPVVLGKTDARGRPLLSRAGELGVEEITPALHRFLTTAGVPGLADPRSELSVVAAGVMPRAPSPLATRTPHFCSGCPHNSSTRAPDGSLVGAGIGCHALIMLAPRANRGVVTGTAQMGGEGGFWLGMAPFVAETHYLQNIGDGTFAHSGSLAVRAAVAAGSHVTFKLLRNSAVAMTGGQQAVGERGLADLVDLLLAEGVSSVVVTSDDPYAASVALHDRSGRVQVRHREDLDQVQRELAQVEGVTVIVHEQECATELRRRWKRGLAEKPSERVFINERICEGCGDCGEKSNCLSVHPVDTDYGRKTRIHQSSCNLDRSCLLGDCPSFVLVTPGSMSSAPRSQVLATRPEPSPLPDPPGPVLHPVGDVVTLRVTGIGGTGVVTIAQVLATAAAIAGWQVRCLDQLGLSQKGGPVVSDIVLSRLPMPRAPRLAAHECNLYLGCDVLVAADPRHLAVADPGRTVAVVSSAQIPTSAMVVDPSVTFPSMKAIESALRQQVRELTLVDAGTLARDRLGDEQFANLVVVGAAYQTGSLPIPATHIGAAIEANGVAVQQNLAAFELGRRAVADPAATLPAPAAPQTLEELVAHRAADLRAYQDDAYAARYRELVARVRGREADVSSGKTELTEAVARNLHKLMAYKDEYEVARLALDPTFAAQVRATFGRDAAYLVQVHPPALRALGRRRKIGLGPAGQAALLRPLIPLRRLRGTRLDPFGHTQVRQVERELITEYVTVVEELLTGLTPATLASAVTVAGLPDLVRGYERIKLAAVTAYRERLHSELGTFRDLSRAAAGPPSG